MVGVIGLTFALRFAAVPSAVVPQALQPSTPALSAPGARPEGDILPLSTAREPAPSTAALFHQAYGSREWVSLVADRLNLRDAGVTQMALWIASCPLRLDASETRVYLAITVAVP